MTILTIFKFLLLGIVVYIPFRMMWRRMGDLAARGEVKAGDSMVTRFKQIWSVIWFPFLVLVVLTGLFTLFDLYVLSRLG